MIRTLLLAVSILCVLAAVGLAFLYFNQHKLAFFPEQLPVSFRFELGPHDEEGFLSLQTGERVNYLLYGSPGRNEGRTGQIIYFHGNAGSLASWHQVGEELRNRTGYAVWIMDYPGFGKSSGETRDEKIMIAMGKHFITTVQAQNPGGRLVLYGRSIGTGVASALAGTAGIKGLILETPYLSLRKLAAEIYPLLPSGLTRINLDNEILAQLEARPPTLIIHGTQDEVIPYHHGRDLSHLLKSSKFVTIEGGTHADLSHSPLYWTELKNFLQTLP